ncbi:MAG: fasciclin domain-containing protein [Bacteroidales bacterium]|nr:fasciclin domain-containing protein [Bacteroidales bacterium]
MKTLKSIILIAVIGLFAFSNNAYAQCESYSSKTQNIVDLAGSSDDLSTLVAAVKAGDLVKTLQGDGPFTVFAPTNAAFEALPKGTLESLLKPENKDKLVQILTYHVVAGKVKSTDLQDGMMAETVQGKKIKIKISGSKVNINEASVATADLMASNGVVHVIDKVILPPEK